MNREPLIRVTKRDGMPLYKNILIRACSIVMAMLLVVFFVHLTAKISAGETLSYMWEGVFGNPIYMRDTATVNSVWQNLRNTAFTATTEISYRARELLRSTIQTDALWL